MITWLLIAVLAGLLVGALFFAVALGDLLARRDVPIADDPPSSLERYIEHVRSGARRARAAWRRWLRRRRSE